MILWPAVPATSSCSLHLAQRSNPIGRDMASEASSITKHFDTLIHCISRFCDRHCNNRVWLMSLPCQCFRHLLHWHGVSYCGIQHAGHWAFYRPFSSQPYQQGMADVHAIHTFRKLLRVRRVWLPQVPIPHLLPTPQSVSAAASTKVKHPWLAAQPATM